MTLFPPISALLMKATAERTAAKAYFFRINEIRNLFCSENTFTSTETNNNKSHALSHRKGAPIGPG